MPPKGKTVVMDEADFLFCQYILKEFDRYKHSRYVGPFKEPVNAAEHPAYHTVIKSPMDLSTIASKLNNKIYGTSGAFKADFDLMFDNCELFNSDPPPSPVLEQGREFRAEFEQEWANKNAWIKRNHPDGMDDVENPEDLPERPLKRLRRSSRPMLSSSNGRSPYISASVMKPSTSAPATPVSGILKQSTSQASSSKQSTLQASSPKPATPKPSTSKSGASKVVASSSNVHQAGSSKQSTSQASSSKPAAPKPSTSKASASKAAASTSNVPQTNNTSELGSYFQDQLKSIVKAEIQTLRKDNKIKFPDEKSFAASFWATMDRDEMDEDDEDESDPNGLKAWTQLAIEAIAKLPLRDIVDKNIKAETKKALSAVMDLHNQFLVDKINRECQAMKRRLD